jgi:hypothetical protein
MALIRCSGCGRASLNDLGKCYFCREVLKFNIWTRKLRRKEAYGFLLVFTGSLLLPTLEGIPVLMVLAGLTLIIYSLFKPRVRPAKEPPLSEFFVL